MKINLPGKFENKMEVDATSLYSNIKLAGLKAGTQLAALELKMEKQVKLHDELMELKSYATRISAGGPNIRSELLSLANNVLTIIN